ncbi:MAG TPA: hypothetical protein VNB22_06235 [Pyrinomonadaceae bacterium]|nr:hypothetical protein [Pyrinomonadaceae bacterium]
MRIKLLPVFFCLFVLSVLGQEKEARRFDEYGTIPCDEYLARADNMIIAQKSNPDSKIYVFVYEGKEKRSVYNKGEMTYKSVLPPRGLAKAKIDSMKKYVALKISPIESYVFANGGLREDFWVEIWVVPNGAEPPKPTPTLKKIKYRKGKARGFCLDCC